MKRGFQFGLISIAAIGLLWTMSVAEEPCPECPADVCPQCQKAQCQKAQTAQQPSDGPLTTLLQIRRFFGDPLQGTALESSTYGDDDFSAAVARVAQLPAPQPAQRVEENRLFPAATVPAPYAQSVPAPTTAPLYVQAVPPPAVATLPLPPYGAGDVYTYTYTYTTPQQLADADDASKSDHAQACVRTVRDSARQLESVANDLEDLGLYEKADELRHYVASLRDIVRDRHSAGQTSYRQETPTTNAQGWSPRY